MSTKWGNKDKKYWKISRRREKLFAAEKKMGIRRAVGGNEKWKLSRMVIVDAIAEAIVAF